MSDDACNECGSTTWVASLVDSDGRRTCAACFIGWTALAQHVPQKPAK